MSLRMTCPNPACAKRYSIPEAGAGRSIRCKGCGETFVAAGSATVDAGAVKPNTPDAEMEPAWDAVSSPSPASPPAAVPMPVGGNTVGRFVIRGKLGAGAFGTVYRAYDPQLDRVVALKVPNPGVMADAKRVERFLREAKATANLRHPHIVPVFDAGKDGDTYYIASAFIDGQPLSDTIDERGTDFPRAARIVRELAEALAYAHEQGIVHRDVKPANMMLDAHDRVHLMDFGLASRQDEEAKLTNDGAVMGTPAYMSPEQAKGQQGEAQPATDQYAAGVVLYELLTGTVPFSGPLAVVMHNVIHTAPDLPRKFRTYIPRDLETICLKAMSKTPGGRYANCQELADDLRRWQEGEPITARRMGMLERSARWVKKEPKLSAATAAIALVLLVSVVFVSGAARRAAKDAADARAAEKRAEDALADARAAREREKQAAGETLGAKGTADQERKKAELLQVRLTLAERSAIQAAYQASLDGALEEARSLLQIVPPERRSWEWRHVQKLCDPPADNPPVLPGKKLVATDQLLGFSPDRTRVVMDGGATVGVRVLDTRTGAEVFILVKHIGKGVRMESASFSADGSRIVTADSDGTARVWDAKAGSLLHTLKGDDELGRLASFSPDGSRIVTTGFNTARVWDAESGDQLHILKGHTALVTSVSFSPDGSRVVTGGRDDTARVWDARTGAILHVLPVRSGSIEVASALFSPDGTRILTGSNDDTARVWDAKTGGMLHVLKGHTALVTSALFSTDGSRVVTVGYEGTARVWDAKTGAILHVLKGHTALVTSALFSTDGSRVVTGSADGTMRVWDAKSGVTLLTIKYPTSVRSLAWNSDGSKLLVGFQYGFEIRDGGLPPPAPKP